MPKVVAYILLFLPLYSSAQSSSNIRFYMDICKFQEINRVGNSVELFFSVDGNSIINVLESDGRYHANVTLDWFLVKLVGNDSLPVGGDQIIMDWPKDHLPKDTAKTLLRNSLITLKTLRLDPGRYFLQGYAEDDNSMKASTAYSTYEFELTEAELLKFSFSDVKWLSKSGGERSAKTGRGGLPLVNNDTFLNPDSLIFYQEIYNVSRVINPNGNSENDVFYIRSRLLRGDQFLSGHSTEDQRREPRLFTVEGQKRSFNAFLNKIQIRDLKTGYYFLQTEVLSQKKTPLKTYRKKFHVHNSRVDLELGAFSRETDIFNEYSEKELDYYLSTLIHTANTQENNFIKVLNEYEQKKNYLYSFFEKRRKADQTVLALWKNYQLTLKFVNSKYASRNRAGWETDRGRVTLKYGIPSDIELKSSEPNLLPYEIWYYDRLGVQTNVIFVFFEKDMNSGELHLLHSSKYGEKSNTRWKSQLTLQNNPGKNN